MRKIKSVFLLLICFRCLQSQAQTKKIVGRVLDAQSNMPIQGASVIVKTTKKGVTTNNDGYFTISANDGEAIQITSIGYAVIEAKASKDVVIKLQQSSGNNLQDVVVVGYGTQKKCSKEREKYGVWCCIAGGCGSG